MSVMETTAIRIKITAHSPTRLTEEVEGFSDWLMTGICDDIVGTYVEMLDEENAGNGGTIASKG
ncbi:hypothetical protein DB346_01995 [Verrucomicrobia bacterium LW23]|nr:hypothetical protein DB346_01995 [Verrucomicrobia bacterium LW23]